MVVSNTILLLNLIKSGLAVSAEIDLAFRKADTEGRNITPEELNSIATENDHLYESLLEKLEG